MSDLAIKRALPNAVALIDAVTAEDQAAVADVLTTLTVTELHALAIILAARCIPDDSETELMTKAVARAAGALCTSPSVVLGSSRRREAIDARAVACYIGYLLGISYSRIGREIGRDHSSVMHAVGRVGETPRLRGAAQRIAEQLGWNREDGVA